MTRFRWPLVSREAYDERGTLVAELRARLIQTEATIAHLTETALHMKQAGYTVSPPVQRIEEVEPSRVDEAITAKAGRNPGLRRYLTNWAKAESQKEGMDESAIAERILDWSDTGDDD
jgi:hypothetical protein